MAQAIAPTDLQDRLPRRTELVAAAARLFSERGYHGTSMRHLGDAVGVLRGSLYAHITSKEELLYEVTNEGAERFLARGREALDSGGGAADRLRSFIVGHVQTATEHMDAATVFLNEWRYLSDVHRAEIRAKRDAYEAMARTIVADGVGSGEFRAAADTTFASLLVLSAGNWVYTWYRPEGELSPEEIGERFADLVIRGLIGSQGAQS